MPTRDSEATGILNKQMLEFVAAWQGNAIAAARAAGYKNPKSSAEKLMNNEAIRAAIKEKQIAMSEESGRLFARELKFCRNDVLNRMWELANLPHEEKEKPSFETQLKAMQSLTEIFDNDITRTADLTRQFEGKTQAEMEFFATHGYFPEPGAKNGE